MHKFTGRRIKHLRQSRGMTQEELGKLLGVKKSAIQKYEADGIDLKASKIKLLCQVFHVLPRYFIFVTDEEFWNSIYGTKLNQEIRSDQMKNVDMWDKDIADGRIGIEVLSLLHIALQLNEKGRAKVDAYISDLLFIDAYTKKEPSN